MNFIEYFATKRNEKSEDVPELNVCFIKIHEVGVDVECDTLSLFHRENAKRKNIFHREMLNAKISFAEKC